MPSGCEVHQCVSSHCAVSGMNKVQSLSPPCSHPSHSCCFASCPRSCLQAVLQAKGEPGTLHQPAKARRALPEQVGKVQQRGCLIRNFKDLCPLLPALYFFYSLLNTPIFSPSLVLVNAAMKDTKQEQLAQKQGAAAPSAHFQFS